MKKQNDWKKIGRRSRRLLLLFGVLVISAGFAVGMREDELECEQAAATLDDCCPGFVVTALDCTYSSGCGTTSYPALSLTEARCITGMACSELIDRKVCERAATASAVIVDEDGGVTGDKEVCP